MQICAVLKSTILKNRFKHSNMAVYVSKNIADRIFEKCMYIFPQKLPKMGKAQVSKYYRVYISKKKPPLYYFKII